MTHSLLIKNGTIVNGDQTQNADILVSDGIIKEIAKDLSADDNTTKIINAKGKYVFPGGIDPHVHMNLPTPVGYSSDDFYTGTRTALQGGTTTIIDFVTPNRGQSLIEALEVRNREAAKSLCNYYFHVSPVEWRDSTQAEIESLIKYKGIRSFKCYMAYQNSVGLNDDDLFRVMRVVGKTGGIVTVHCELGDEIEVLREKYSNKEFPPAEAHLLSRPSEMEAEAVMRAIQLARKANCPLYIVHVSSAQSLEHIAKAQQEDQVIYAETCPQYLLLDQSNYKRPFEEAAAYVMSPPLRTNQDNEALWDAIANGVVQTIGTDHCPFTLEQKRQGFDDFRKIPNGAGGVEHRMSLLFTYGVLQNRISLNKYVELTSTNPAKIFGLYPRKGVVADGSDADILIWNPEKENTISVKNQHQNSDLNIYEGFETKGDPEYVIHKGAIISEKGILIS